MEKVEEFQRFGVGTQEVGAVHPPRSVFRRRRRVRSAPGFASLRPILLVLAVGCATSPEIYRPPDHHYIAQQRPIEDGRPQIEHGRANVVLDSLNHYLFSLPTKLLLWDWQLLDHRLPHENQQILEHYLEMNQLRSVKIRHNQYDPIGEFRRLLRNQEVGPLYRATLGLITWLRYTLLPDRLLAGLPVIGGGDHFNPFTNTINVYSSDITVLLHEAGHAKDYVQHDFKGTSFALPRLLPGIDLLQEAAASADAIRFLHCIRDRKNELRAYRTLIPAYSTYIAGYFQGGLELTLPIVTVGHISARIQAARRSAAMDEVDEGRRPHVGSFTKDAFLPEWCVPFVPTSDNLEIPEELRSDEPG